MTHELMARPGIVFDFDGPICSIFARLPAPTVADDLRQIARRHGSDTTAINNEDDPLEVLRWAGQQDTRLLVVVEDALIKAETTAAATAEPTIGAHELLRNVHAGGSALGIASNNSPSAVVTYLAAHDLLTTMGAIAGRRPYAPEAMKPHSGCLHDCILQLGIAPGDCVFIGDSLTDVQAARQLGVAVIALANKPYKRIAFSEIGADLTILDLGELA